MSLLDTVSIKPGDKFTIETGRMYDGKQVLECQVFSCSDDEDVVFNVTDSSRYMEFNVEIWNISGINKQDILTAYDSGDYSTLHRTEA